LRTRARTWTPMATKRETTWRPTVPVPPITRIRFMHHHPTLFDYFPIPRDTLVTSRTCRDPDTAAIPCSAPTLSGHSLATKVVQCLRPSPTESIHGHNEYIRLNVPCPCGGAPSGMKGRHALLSLN